MATNFISALGAGSGLDSKTIVESLVAAEREGRTQPLRRQVEALGARISALGQLRSGLTGIATSLDSRMRSGALGVQMTSSDTAIGVERRGLGPPGPSSNQLVVNRLAAGQRLASAALAGSDAPVGTGTLTFSFGRITPGVGSDFSFAPGGRAPVTINITPANNSLAGLAAAINASGAGISASVVANAGNATLVLRGADGANNGFIISAAPDVAAPGLDRFSHTPGAPTMTRSQTAVDAELTLDGVAVQRASNVIDDLLPGTRLRLNRTTTGASLVAARAPGALAGTMADLADTLNGMRALVADFRKSASNGDAAGALANDPTARAMDQQLVGLISRPIASANGLRLADLGIRITREGAVQFDEARLASLGDDRQNDAEALLRHISGPASSSQPDRLQSIAASMAGALDGMGRRRDNASRAITRAEAQVETLRISLTRQFAAMDAAVASSRAVGQQLQTTIDMWTARD